MNTHIYNRNKEPILTSILGNQMYFSENEEREKGETERHPAQKPNTGDWGDESDWEETDREENRRNDNSGGAGSTGSESTNS